MEKFLLSMHCSSYDNTAFLLQQSHSYHLSTKIPQLPRPSFSSHTAASNDATLAVALHYPTLGSTLWHLTYAEYTAQCITTSTVHSKT